MAGATNLSDLELESRAIQARESDSGAADDGDVLTADGAGGAAWAAAAGGGGGGACTGVVWLGSLGTDNVAVMNGEISAAYLTATGAAPANGALAGFIDLWNAMPQVAVYWADQGIWRGLWTVLSSVEGVSTTLGKGRWRIRYGASARLSYTDSLVEEVRG